jgi:hypothetical protein
MHWYGPKAAPRDVRAIADPVGFILGTGVGLAQLAIGVLGVLVITSEYSTGVVRASLLAVPRRLPVLAAKARATSMSGPVMVQAGDGPAGDAEGGEPVRPGPPPGKPYPPRHPRLSLRFSSPK